jgi:hypothetical protein
MRKGGWHTYDLYAGQSFDYCIGVISNLVCGGNVYQGTTSYNYRYHLWIDLFIMVSSIVQTSFVGSTVDF